MYKADAGTVCIDGAPVFDNPAVKNQMAYVPDELYFLSGSSMDRMAGLYAAIYPRFDRERYRSLTAAFRLDPGSP